MRHMQGCPLLKYEVSAFDNFSLFWHIIVPVTWCHCHMLTDGHNVMRAVDTELSTSKFQPFIKVLTMTKCVQPYQQRLSVSEYNLYKFKVKKCPLYLVNLPVLAGSTKIYNEHMAIVLDLTFSINYS